MAKNIKNRLSCLINEVAQRVGLSQKRIREYEKVGLISPTRDPKTNNRRFSEKDIRQILRIKALIHEHGFTLASLRFMAANMPCWIIFECDEKQGCPGSNSPRTPCYEVAWKSVSNEPRKNCDQCPVFLNRDLQKMALLERA